MSNPYSHLAAFQETKNELIAIIDQTIALSEELGLEDQQVLTAARENLEQERFQVVVVGEFNRGKSYLINALLGQAILPTGIRPTTAALTTIAYGQESRAVLHYHDNLGLAPREVSFAELKQLVTALTPDSEQQAQAIKLAEVHVDSELCAHGVTIVDTPGVNDLNEQREEITYRFIPQSHAAILVLDATMPLSRSEKEFLENRILASDIQKIFFVLNKASLIPEGEAAAVTAYTKQNLEAIPGLGKVRLFLIDAKEQLKAGGDLQRLSPTNQFREFAEELQRFLVQERVGWSWKTPATECCAGWPP